LIVSLDEIRTIRPPPVVFISRTAAMAGNAVASSVAVSVRRHELTLGSAKSTAS
jgi:hypothetical protein